MDLIRSQNHSFSSSFPSKTLLFLSIHNSQTMAAVSHLHISLHFIYILRAYYWLTKLQGSLYIKWYLFYFCVGFLIRRNNKKRSRRGGRRRKEGGKKKRHAPSPCGSLVTYIVDAVSKLEGNLNRNLERAVKEIDRGYLTWVPPASTSSCIFNGFKSTPMNEVLLDAILFNCTNCIVRRV